MDYEKKYLKYKSKYNLKKSSLVGGGGIMTGGNIDAIAGLVFRDVPMIRADSIYRGFYENTIQVIKVKQLEPSQITWTENDLLEAPEKKVNISNEWAPYIQFIHSSIPSQRFTLIKISFKDGILPNQYNARGQTLLFLAAQNCNKQMIDALVAMGVRLTDINRDGNINPVGGINRDGSTILHGIAWGKVNDQGRPIKTYDEKVAFMIDILGRYPIETIPLLFRVNQRGETCYDNLLRRHQDKISTSLEDVAFPLGWVKRSDTNGKIYYENTSTGLTQWFRPY
jgi:hypothetical protein